MLISYEIVGKMVHCVNTNSSSSRLSSSLSLFRRNIKPRSYTGFAVASEAVMATPFPPCPPHPQAALHQPLLGTTKSWITTTYWLKNLNDVKGKETIVEEECWYCWFLRLVHVVRDFRPWDVMTKVRYFLMVQIYNLRTLEVEHDLETCQRPLGTLWASQGL